MNSTTGSNFFVQYNKKNNNRSQKGDLTRDRLNQILFLKLLLLVKPIQKLIKLLFKILG